MRAADPELLPLGCVTARPREVFEIGKMRGDADGLDLSGAKRGKHA
jgi:hypothetical protein